MSLTHKQFVNELANKIKTNNFMLKLCKSEIIPNFYISKQLHSIINKKNLQTANFNITLNKKEKNIIINNLKESKNIQIKNIFKPIKVHNKIIYFFQKTEKLQKKNNNLINKNIEKYIKIINKNYKIIQINTFKEATCLINKKEKKIFIPKDKIIGKINKNNITKYIQKNNLVQVHKYYPIFSYKNKFLFFQPIRLNKKNIIQLKNNLIKATKYISKNIKNKNYYNKITLYPKKYITNNNKNNKNKKILEKYTFINKNINYQKIKNYTFYLLKKNLQQIKQIKKIKKLKKKIIYFYFIQKIKKKNRELINKFISSKKIEQINILQKNTLQLSTKKNTILKPIQEDYQNKNQEENKYYAIYKKNSLDQLLISHTINTSEIKNKSTFKIIKNIKKKFKIMILSKLLQKLYKDSNILYDSGIIQEILLDVK